MVNSDKDILIAKLLIDSGADVNARDDKYDHNRTALLNAAHCGAKETVNMLIGAGADINAQSIGGFTALMFAIIKEHKYIAMVLLKHGADPNISNDYGDTALSWAKKKGYIKVYKQLIK